MTKKKILLVGGGGHCRSCIDVLENLDSFEIFGIIDKPELKGTRILGYEVIGSDEDLPDLLTHCRHALITVGQIKTPEIRSRLFAKLEGLGFSLPVIVSHLAYVSPHASIGEGTIVMHHALVNAAARVGVNCILNTKSLIEHDCTIEDHCHISTGAIINGGVNIKTGTFVGSNAVTKEYTASRENDFIKAGITFKGYESI
jgi:sugar O-acyltransferase (sialic acid O-acetyltransferase NeuD family)